LLSFIFIMFKSFLTVLATSAAVCFAAAAEPSRIERATTLMPKPEPAPEVVVEEPVVEEPEITCKGCSLAEQETLEFFYDEGVTDTHALAMIMGSIRQESRFQPSVCEGGFITSWRGCTRGGFGLIQFTSYHRYYGLGDYASRTGQAPEALNTQLEYIVTEREWQSAAAIFKREGLPMGSYDYAGKIWLGYGIKGNRLFYAWQYVSKIA